MVRVSVDDLTQVAGTFDPMQFKQLDDCCILWVAFAVIPSSANFMRIAKGLLIDYGVYASSEFCRHFD